MSIMENQLETKMEHEMKAGLIEWLIWIRVSGIRGTLVGVPIMKIPVFWDLRWAPPICGIPISGLSLIRGKNQPLEVQHGLGW